MAKSDMKKTTYTQRLECLNSSCGHIIHNAGVVVLGQEGEKVVRCPACGGNSWKYIMEPIHVTGKKRTHISQ